MIRLLLHGTEMSVELSATPVYIGRAPTNDLILTDRAVSSRHAAVFTSGERVFVEDLGSRNGTFVGEVRVRKIAEVPPDEVLWLARTVELRIERPPGAESGRLLVLQDLDGALQIPLRGDRVQVGSIELRVGRDRVWNGATEIPLGGELRVDGRRYRLAAADPVLSLTAEESQIEGPRYDLRVELTGSPGPRAVLTDPTTGATLELVAPNRVVLLYVLGRRAKAEEALEASVRGWCTDAEVAAALWGRQGQDRNLNVLVTRIRNDLRRVGLDPWFLEKKQGHLRARLGAVELIG